MNIRFYLLSRRRREWTLGNLLAWKVKSVQLKGHGGNVGDIRWNWLRKRGDREWEWEVFHIFPKDFLVTFVNLFIDVISKFRFNLPTSREDLTRQLEHDDDNDTIVRRKMNECIEIGQLLLVSTLTDNHTHWANAIQEHKKSTVLSEVGLQVWRGAFLLNDFILSNRELFSNKTVIELGSGVGLTSILASVYAKKVICTGSLTLQRLINLKDNANL